jgi:hypothetical protein
MSHLAPLPVTLYCLPFMPWVGRILQLLRARFHSLCGWMWFRGGSRLRARPHYERVLQLKGDDFDAYVHLGRIAFAVGDYAGWRREFEHARRTDPLRFARLRHPFELFEPRLAGTNFDDQASSGSGLGVDPGFTGASERATWRSLLFGPSHRHSTGLRNDGLNDGLADADRKGLDNRVLPETPAGFDAGLEALWSGDAGPRGDAGRRPNNPPEGHPAESPADDCASAAERRRFRELGPIRANDVGTCDLDDLARRLSG